MYGFLCSTLRQMSKVRNFNVLSCPSFYLSFSLATKMTKRHQRHHSRRACSGCECCLTCVSALNIKHTHTHVRTKSFLTMGCTFIEETTVPSAPTKLLPYQIKWNEKMAFQFKFIGNIIHYFIQTVGDIIFLLFEICRARVQCTYLCVVASLSCRAHHNITLNTPLSRG